VIDHPFTPFQRRERGARLHTLGRTLRDLDLKAVAISGLAAGAAFVAVLEADLRLTGRNVDDLMVLGRPFAEEPRKARAVGGTIHALNSLVLATLYAMLERRLPGPDWLSGKRGSLPRHHS
jgi:hypothetical protein